MGVKKCVVITQSFYHSETHTDSVVIKSVVEGGLALESLKKALEQEVLPGILNRNDLKVVPTGYKLTLVASTDEDQYGLPYGSVEVHAKVEYIGRDPVVKDEYLQLETFFFEVREFNLVSLEG